MWLTMIRPFAPYLVVGAAAAALGGYGAWQVQGVRLAAAKNEFEQYKTAQVAAAQEAAAVAQKQREQADYDYQAVAGKLKAEIDRNEVYRRCVAAGKCGAPVRVSPASCEAGAVSPARSDDDPGPNAVPLGAGEPTDGSETPAVVNDCATTTLRLNELQRAIEAQKGY